MLVSIFAATTAMGQISQSDIAIRNEIVSALRIGSGVCYIIPFLFLVYTGFCCLQKCYMAAGLYFVRVIQYSLFISIFFAFTYGFEYGAYAFTVFMVFHIFVDDIFALLKRKLMKYEVDEVNEVK